ncbi:MAG TPA: BatA domain-containing protein [Tepidisphaeraceae bacterium]|jgi:Mg-chelatase subunit ChlD
MSFITPFFAVVGLLAVAIPVAIHLLNRRRYRVREWAAMQFLLAAMRRNRRRLQFEQWLLLAARCLLVALIGLALARPVGCSDGTLARMAGESAAVHVIVIDDSYSMAYEAQRPDALTHLDQAKALARQLVTGLTSGSDSVAIVSASTPARGIILEPTYDLPAALAAIDRVAQRNVGTDLVGAFTLAEQIAGRAPAGAGKVLHVLSDATTSAWRNGNEAALAAAGPRLAAAFRVRHYNLSRHDQLNAAVIDVAPIGNLVRTRFANDFRAVARAYGGTSTSSLLWSVGDQTLPTGPAVLLNLQTEPITQSNVQLRSGGPTVVTARLGVEDRLKTDNARYRTIDVASEMKVLIVEGRRGMNPLEGSAAFLNLALAPPAPDAQDGRQTASYVKTDRISDIELGGRLLGEYRAVMLADVAQVPAPLAEALASYVKSGGTVIWFMGEQVQRESYNATLLPRGLLPGPLTQRQTGDYTFAFNPAGNLHVLLAAFANRPKSGLDTTRVFTYWQVSPDEKSRPERVLDFSATATAGGERRSPDPAVTLHRLGEGRVVFVATSADDEWTNFPVKPAYIALVHEILAGTVAGSERWTNLLVGERVEIPVARQLGGTPRLIDPANGSEQPLEQTVKADGTAVYASPPIERPGVYRLQSGPLGVPVSVNVPADEADIRPLTDEAIRSALGDIDLELLGDALPAAGGADEDRRDFGWSVMTIVLCLLGLECFMAMRFGHHRKAA